MLRFNLLAVLGLAAAAQATPAATIAWEPWSDSVFARAEREHRFVLMDLEAVWCHWCHVMAETTYQDPQVIKLIGQRYIAVRVDQDSRPDISRRYENYGWPATVVFAADGTEIAKRRGYVPPPMMSSMLQAIIDDPSPIQYGDENTVTQFAANPLLSEKVRQELERQFYETDDAELGALKQGQKFIDRDTVEYGLLRAGQDDARAAQMTRRTLDHGLKLIDPVWGGAYQYSTDSDWDHPHFEKIMSVQAEDLRLYALAFGQFHDERYRAAAQSIHRYLKSFLMSPEGAFYTSQDADLIRGEHSAGYFALGDAARRKLGIPVVDRNSYARENGWAIQALVTLSAVTGDRGALDEALAAARWVMAHRALPGGGFRHGEVDSAGPYLEDTLAMGRAFLALYATTGDRQWLKVAEAAEGFIEGKFRSASQPGYFTSVEPEGSKLKPVTIVDENILMARFANLLHRYTGAPRYQDSAARAMRYLATEEIALTRLTSPGILQAGFELANEPAHITVVGARGDRQAIELFRAALEYPAVYRRIEWWDRGEGNLPNSDVQYPKLARAAAFVCADGTCSLPIYEAAGIVQAASTQDHH